MGHLITATFALIALITFVTREYSQGTTVNRADAKPFGTSQNKAPAGPPAATIETIKGDLSEAYAIIDKDYAGDKKLDTEDLFNRAINSMLTTLDPHSKYLNAKDRQKSMDFFARRYVGIGITHRGLIDKEGKTIGSFVRSTFAGSPARAAGLLYGDKIVEINGISTLGKSSAEVRELILGEQGTTVKVVVERLIAGERVTAEIKRDAILQPTIEDAYMIRPGIGYISMRYDWHQPTYDEFVSALNKVKSQGMQQLIIDLRGNGGGQIIPAMSVANRFLPNRRTILWQAYRIGRNGTRSAMLKPEKAPLVLLVNQETASASEIFSGAMQDNDRALVVGEHTFGKGIIQSVFVDIPFGGELDLTTSRYLTPSGRSIQRDYSKVSYYEYINGGLMGSVMPAVAGIDTESTPANNTERPAYRTHNGRTVYGGGGIDPDVVVKPKPVSAESGRRQVKLQHPIFAFAMELAAGRVKGFDQYKVAGPTVDGHDLSKYDYPVDDALIAAFKSHAADKYGINSAVIDMEKDFVSTDLRAEIITAAYGTVTAMRATNEVDVQITRGIELLPEAKRLIERAAVTPRGKTTSTVAPTPQIKPRKR